MAVAVAAAGSVAGSLAGQALMGSPKAYDGGGIADITTTKPAGKNNKNMEGIPQIDASGIYQWYDDAAKVQTDAYQKGFDLYSNSLQLANNQLVQSYANAESELRPQDTAGKQALNEAMKFMGLTPQSATSDFASKAGGLITDQDTLNLISQAEKETNTGARANLQSQVIQSLQNQKRDLLAVPEKPSFTGKYTDAEVANLKRVASGAGLTESTAAAWVPIAKQRLAEQQASLDRQQAAYDAQVADIQKQNQDITAKNAQIDELAKQYQTSYTPEFQQAYTGDQIAEKLAATPGYQFTLDQGTKAIERQGAAVGMLGSSNTQIALQKYGQNLAQTTYQNHLSNLMNVANLGSQATSQIAQNKIGLGTAQAGLIDLGGQAAMNTSNMIGNAQAQALQNKAATRLQVAQFNATLQANKQNANMGQAMQLASAGAGLINAQTNAAKLNYSVFQNSQYAQGYLNNSSGGSTGAPGTWSIGSNGWPTYNAV